MWVFALVLLLPRMLGLLELCGAASPSARPCESAAGRAPQSAADDTPETVPSSDAPHFSRIHTQFRSPIAQWRFKSPPQLTMTRASPQAEASRNA